MPDPTRAADIIPNDLRSRALARAEAADTTEADPEPPADAETQPEIPTTIPRRFRQATYSQLSGNLAHLVDDWVAGGMNANVMLLGSVGVGKTHAACIMAILAHQAGSRVRFAPVVELLDQLRPGGDPTALQRACDVDVLVLDDIGVEKPTDWTGERLYAVINRRWLEERPTIATSNLPLELAKERVGAQAWSRLYHGALRLAVAGKDRRVA